jgi:hypothetical protein
VHHLCDPPIALVLGLLVANLLASLFASQS